MKIKIAFIAGLLLTAGLASGQTGKAPAFSSYPAKIEAARAKDIDFRSSPDARTFRTRLRAALRGGVNFAGRYIIASWGCGTGCIAGAVIDGRTGKVYFPEQLGTLGVGYSENAYDEPLVFRKNSRLLVLNGMPGSADDSAEVASGTYYYEWKNNRFDLIRFVAAKENR